MPKGRAEGGCHNGELGANVTAKGQVLVGQVLVPLRKGHLPVS
jgi:hypothetical protein